MGCCLQNAKTLEEQEQQKKNREIESVIHEDKKKNNTKMKLLLLGTGDAGKSTFIKQMKLIHRDGFQQNELQQSTGVLRDNCLTCMSHILLACQNWSLEIPDNLKKAAQLVINADELTEEVARAIQALWKTKEVREAFKRENEIQLPGGPSGAVYFFEHALQFADKDYIPTQEDVLRCKMRTTGIAEVTFKVERTEFKMVDVGGQRSERRKWLNCFSDVSAVIFLAALNEYDMVLEEDNVTNRMQESLTLFEKLSHSQWFEQTSFILFLNKSDLFREKIKTRPLSNFFEDYDTFVMENNNITDDDDDEDEFEKSCQYVQSQYVTAFKGKILYPFVTCAIDTENCVKVFKAVRDTVLSQSLAQIGFK